jgi:alpha-mannosidase
MSLTLLRAPTFPDETSDQGTHTFTYGFTVWHGSFFDSPVVREAYELNVPLTVAPKGGSPDPQSLRIRSKPITHSSMSKEASMFSLFRADAETIIAESVKLAEDGSGHWVIRLYESKGASVSCTLAMGVPVGRAWETDMLEQVKGELPHTGNDIRLSFRPFEVKTIRVAP